MLRLLRSDKVRTVTSVREVLIVALPSPWCVANYPKPTMSDVFLFLFLLLLDIRIPSRISRVSPLIICDFSKFRGEGEFRRLRDSRQKRYSFRLCIGSEAENTKRVAIFKYISFWRSLY